jgi:hypothetical protein
VENVESGAVTQWSRWLDVGCEGSGACLWEPCASDSFARSSTVSGGSVPSVLVPSWPALSFGRLWGVSCPRADAVPPRVAGDSLAVGDQLPGPGRAAHGFPGHHSAAYRQERLHKVGGHACFFFFPRTLASTPGLLCHFMSCMGAHGVSLRVKQVGEGRGGWAGLCVCMDGCWGPRSQGLHFRSM